MVFNLNLTSLKEKATLVCLSILLFTSLYFLTTNRIEIFGWMSAFITHFMPITFVVFSAWVVVKKTNSFIDYFFLLLSAFLIGGSAEHITPFVLSLIARLIFITKVKNKKLFYFTICLVCVYLISVITPGTLYRINTTTNYIQQHPVLQNTNPLHFVSAFLQPYKVVGVLLLFVCWGVLLKVFDHQTFKIKWHLFFIPVAISFIIALFVAAFVYKSFAETRLLFIVDFALFVALNVIALKLIQKTIRFHFLLSGLTIASLAIILFFSVRHIPRLRYFANQYDQAINYLKQQPENQVITISDFPDPDLTNQALLYADPKNEDNELFCRFYNIKAKVSVKN